MFKVNRRRSVVFVVNFENISHLVLVVLLITLNMSMPTEILVSVPKLYFLSGIFLVFKML